MTIRNAEKMMSQKTPWDLDVRIRDRNLQKGVLGPKDLEKYLNDLPDVAENAETLHLAQPTFEGEAADQETGKAADEPGA